MAKYFEKCCFDSEKMGVINECDRMSCILNRKHDFDVYFHHVSDESFYCLNRKQLGEFWHCVIEDQNSFCPEKCEKCDVCKELAEVSENLQDGYFFKSSEHKHQPVSWKVIFKRGNNSKKFRIEIAKTIESDNLVLEHGLLC